MSEVICPVCQRISPVGAKFCSNCGSALDTAPPSQGTERRRVTVLFGDLTDFTGWAEDLDPERVGTVTDRVLAACTAVVLDHGGAVDKLTGDGIMGVFGAPLAHEDDAERAVSAALAMQAAVPAAVAEVLGTAPEGRLGLRVGLNTGIVLAGVQAAMSYTVVGDAVNTAARLSDVAGVGGILAGRETALATMHMAAWRAMPALALKGKREVVAAFELVELRDPLVHAAPTAGEVPLFGRDVELGQLIALLDGAERTRQPRSVLLVGEAGAGKTRLLVELSRFGSEQPDARVLWGRCAPYGVGRELAPLVEIVRAALELPDAPTSELEGAVAAALARLEHAAGSVGAPGLAERILGLLGAVADPASPGGLPGAQARRDHPRLEAELDAAAAVLRLLARLGPLIVIVDDLHWAPPQLRQALADLADRLDGAVLLAGAGRFDVAAPGVTDPAGEADWWAGMPRPLTLAVLPLPDDAVDALLKSHLGGAGIGPTVRALLLERAQGNPFYLEELLHLLIDQGLLERAEDGTWVAQGDLPTELLPVGVQALISARLDVLSPAAKTVLRDAAVLGPRVPLAGLAALSEGQGIELGTTVADLVQRRLLVRRPGAARAGETYAFGHALTRDVAYAAVPKAERALLHATAALWASREPSGGDVDQIVATHADRALVLAQEMSLPETSLAFEVRSIGSLAYRRLARAAAARDDHRAAAGLTRRAIELGGPVLTPEELLSIQVGWAAELAAVFELDEAEAALLEPLAKADSAIRCPALVVLGDVLRKRGREAEATRSWVSAFALASEAGLDRVAGEAIRNLGLQDYFAGRFAAAEERFQQALQLARRVGDDSGSGWALQHLAWSRTSRGAFESADATLREAAGVFAGLDDIGGLSWCAGTEALVRVLQGRYNECRGLIGGLLPSALELGDRWGIAACRTIDALAATELGDPGHGREQATLAVTAFEEMADPWGQVLALGSLGIALRGLGCFEEAAEVLDRAVVRAAETTAPLTAIVALAARGQVALDAGDLAGADAASARAQELLTGIELAPGARVAVVVLRAQVLRARGDLTASLALLEDVAATDHRDVVLFPQRQTLAHLAGVRLALGDVAGARSAVELALVTPAEDVRSRVIALRALGSVRHAEGDDRGARATWQEAMAVAQSSGQVSERPATQRLLDSV